MINDKLTLFISGTYQQNKDATPQKRKKKTKRIRIKSNNLCLF